MQIQRLQTLYLIIAVILTGMFCFFPYAESSVSNGEVEKILVSDSPVLMILSATITILLVISIFMYKNLKQQMKMTVVNAALILGTVITSLIYIYVGQADTVPAFDGGVILLVLAFSFCVGAYRRMKHDKNLLAAADRLR